MNDATENINTPFNLITVHASHQAEITAKSADLSVTVRATALVAGGMALQKSREVYTLVEMLKRVDIPETQIQIESVQAEVTNGVVVKSSARYQLMIRVEHLGAITDVLAVLMEAKNTTLNGITWRYPQEETDLNEWLALCAVQARQRAEHIASAFGVALGTLHKFSYDLGNGIHLRPGMYVGGGSMNVSRSSNSAITQPDLEIKSTKTVTITAEAVFHVT